MKECYYFDEELYRIISACSKNNYMTHFVQKSLDYKPKLYRYSYQYIVMRKTKNLPQTVYKC